MTNKTVLPLILLAVAIAGVILTYEAGHPFHSYLFNSDALYLPVLFQDIFERSGRFSDWFLTPAPYFFPDYLLYLPGYLITESTQAQVLTFALLQIICTTVALYRVAKAVDNPHPASTSIIISIFLIWLSINAKEPFVELLTSAFHFGAFLSALILVALWLELAKDQKTSLDRLALAMGMCALAFLTTLSDNLFLVHTIAPFFVASILLQHASLLRKRLTLPIAVLGAAVLGSLAYHYVVTHNTRVSAEIGLTKFASNAGELLHLAEGLFRQYPWVGALFFIHLALGVAAFVACARKKELMRLPQPLLLLLAFSFLSQGSLITVLLCMTNIPIAPRYLITVLIWPLIVSMFTASHLLGRRSYWIGIASCLIPTSLLLVEGMNSYKAKTKDPFYSEQLACIDKAVAARSLQNGIAQYWDAKYLQSFSRSKLTLAQHAPDLSEVKWITSEKFFQDRYDFAIISKNPNTPGQLPERSIIAINGKPAETLECGNYKIMIYGKDKLRLKKIVNPGDAYLWEACTLPTQIGIPTQTCAMEKSNAHQKGFIAYGPYEALPEGKYKFEIKYISSAPASDVIGEWDVLLQLPNTTSRIKADKMPGTAGQPRTIAGSFDVSKDQHMAQVEVRVFSDSNGTIRLDSILLTRQE